MAVVILVRHGHSTANRDGVLAGWLGGIGLTQTGIEQARALSAQLAAVPLALVATSPLQRSQETALALLAGRSVQLRVEDGLGECHYGAWTGRRLADLQGEQLWRTVQDSPQSVTFPGGAGAAGHRAESLAAMTARVVGAVRALDAQVQAAQGVDAVWVAVSHGDPIKAVLAVAGGGDVRALQRHHVDPGSLSVVRFAGQRSVVLAANATVLDVRGLVAATSAAVPGDLPVGGGAG